MKKYCSIFLLITALACQKESDKVTILHATVEDSRTTLDYPSILWSPDDAIVVNGKTSTAISIYNDGHGADFTLPELTAPYSAVYPASAYATSVRAILPSEQKYVPGGFDPSAALMWGYSEDNPDIRFQCGVALLK
ncbi:MAG: hypothetical protein J5764_06830, partial [Bacteroidales bacterium]|nr:hypothetical protein [Bacteroidales bacterium]